MTDNWQYMTVTAKSKNGGKTPNGGKKKGLQQQSNKHF